MVLYLVAPRKSSLEDFGLQDRIICAGARFQWLKGRCYSWTHLSGTIGVSLWG